MIYVCVPVHNEARTAGLVLWKVRQVFTAFPREYQLLVLDDASTDETPVVLASYAKVLPMTIVTHRAREGYARSLEELLRLALQRTDRPKRDCAITLHADFAHSPESMEDMVKRLESWRARTIIRAAHTAVALLVLAASLCAQSDTGRADSTRAAQTSASLTATASASAPSPTAVPFRVGERLVYGARYGPFSVGTASRAA